VSSKLIAWLRQQAEADKTAAASATPGPWVFEGDDPADDELYSTHDEHLYPTVAYTRDGIRGNRQVANGRHMERHDPLTEAARADAVLAVLDALEDAVQRRTAEQADFGAWVRGETTGKRPEFPGPHPALIPGLELTVRLLATGYRHREGYKEEWAPDLAA
jgi:Family of unknown function (DUF6221)